MPSATITSAFKPDAQGTSAGSAAFNTIGAISKGISAYQTDKSSASADFANATVAGENAAAEGQTYASGTAIMAAKNAQSEGEQRAAIGESGTGTGGTNALAERQTEVNNMLNTMQYQYQGQMKRVNYLDQQQNDLFQGKLAKNNATTALASGGMSATAAMLTGLQRYGNMGVPGASAPNNTPVAPDLSGGGTNNAIFRQYQKPGDGGVF